MAATTPSPSRPRPGQWTRTDRFVVGATIVALALWTSSDATLTDPFWMAREGVDVLAGGGWSHLDRWGATSAQYPFVPTSPLWQVWLGAAWQAAGSTGLLLAAAAGIALTLTAVAMASKRLGSAPLGAVVALIVLTLVPAAVTIRPTTAAAGLLVAVVASADWLLERSRRPVAAVTGLVLAGSALGIWIHASWVAYGPLAGLAAGALVAQHRGIRRSPQFALLPIAAGVLGAGLGPRGTRAWGDARRIQAEMRGVITEWISPWEHPTTTAWLWLWLMLIAVAGLALLSAWRGRPHTAALEWAILSIACILLLGAATALRLIPQGAVLLTPWLAHAISGGVFTSTRRRLNDWQEPAHARTGRLVSAVVACSLLPMAATGAVAPYPQLHDPAFSRLPGGCRLLTEAATANLVLLARVDVRPWLDGRADMWGRQHLIQSFRYLSGAAEELVPADVDCVLQQRSRANRLTTRLDADGSWLRINPAGSALRLWVRK